MNAEQLADALGAMLPDQAVRRGPPQLGKIGAAAYFRLHHVRLESFVELIGR